MECTCKYNDINVLKMIIITAKRHYPNISDISLLATLEFCAMFDP